MTYNLSYDYASATVMATMLFFYIVTPKFKNLQNRVFGLILLVNFLNCILDILSAGILLPQYPDVIWANSLVLLLYQNFQHMVAPLYYIYIMLVIYKDSFIQGLKKGGWVTLLPAALLLLVNLSSPLTNLGYIYNETGYHRTAFYYAATMVATFYIVLSLVMAFHFKNKTGFLPKFTVIIYTVMTITFTVLQLKYPTQLILCSAGTLSIFIMYLSLQSPTLLKEALEDAESSRKTAEEANAAKSNFLANMSHEIRTPMNAICGMAYLLESSSLTAEAKEYVNTIQAASDNLLNLINEILDFSKVDAGKMELNEEEYHIDKVVKDVTGMMFSQVNNPKIVTSLYIAPDVPKVLRGDVTKVKQIMLNLLSNAIKFTDQGQVLLHISAERKDNNKVSLRIKVKDTGIGIREEDQNRMFEQFAQLDMAKTRKRDGSGIGLSIVKSFAELMHGHIEVDSTYGSGSTFTAVLEQAVVEEFDKAYLEDVKKYTFVVLAQNPFEKESIERTLGSINANYSIEDKLPEKVFDKFEDSHFCLVYNYSLYKDEVGKLSAEEKKHVQKLAIVDYGVQIPEEDKETIYARNPFSLLTIIDSIKNFVNEKEEVPERVYFDETTKIALVDDNKVNLKVTSAILKKFGIKAEMMLSGYEMLDALDNGNVYDLIFMDHMMPDMDGIETTKRIRELKKGNCQKVPVVALTANAIKGVEEEFFAAGMVDVIFKPVNVNELQNILAKWIPKEKRTSPPEETSAEKNAEKKN